MKELAEMLEEELAQAFEVKNQKSLHRYVVLLTSGYVEQESHQRQFAEVTGSLKEILASMKEGFRRMDDHFESMNKRFDDMNTRFDSQHKLISLGFAAIALIITAFNLTLILT